METRFLLRSATRTKLPYPRHLRHRQASSNSKPSYQQANPLGDYYESLLEAPSPRIKSKPPTTASPASQPQPAISTRRSDDSSGSKPAIVFSSRLSSPLERRSEIQRKSNLIAGVWVPPRPEEPDNCCMSGCVNCVWDLYRDEMEEWAAKRREADHALRKEKSLEGARKKRRRTDAGMSGSTSREPQVGQEDEDVARTMDDDGGGSEALWGQPLDSELTGDDLYKNIPVGIREFMKQEKRLKEQHAREAAAGSK